MYTLHLRGVASREEFASLRSEWDACLGRSAQASVFVTWEWLYHWWTHYGSNGALHLIVARRDDRMVGLLPLYRTAVRALPGVAVPVLRFVGTGGDTSPDYLGPVVDADGAAETTAALCRAVLDAPGWDGLVLSDISEDSPFIPAMQAACREVGAPAWLHPHARISVVPLPASWDAYLGTLHRDRRSSIRRARRRLEEQPGARFFVWRDAENLNRAIDRLVELHHLRWGQHSGSFATPQYVGFHRDLMHALFARDWLRLYCLEVGGEIAAMYYCYRYGDEVSYFQAGFDPRHERLRPGYVLMGWAIEHAIGEGMRLFDMLKGEYAHKDMWTDERRTTRVLRAYRRSPRGLLLAAVQEHLSRARRRVRRLMPTSAA